MFDLLYQNKTCFSRVEICGEIKKVTGSPFEVLYSIDYRIIVSIKEL